MTCIFVLSNHREKKKSVPFPKDGTTGVKGKRRKSFTFLKQKELLTKKDIIQ